MNEKKEKLIRLQKLMAKVFWNTLFFLFGFVFSIWMAWELAGKDVLVRLIPVIRPILLLLFLELFTIALIFLAKRKSSNVSQENNFKQIEELGELKEKGLLTDEEFQAEKKKLLGNT